MNLQTRPSPQQPAGAAADPATAGFDPARKFVRVIGEREGGFVEFEFAVGEPELFVEMILPAAAFSDFCSLNAVVRLDPRPAAAEDGGDFEWRLHDATQQRFR